MASTMKVPGIGAVNTKWVITGGALVVGIAAYAYWKQSQASADTSADPSTDGADSTDGTVYSADQGIGYGTDPYGSDYYPPSSYNPYPYATGTTPPPPASNQDWDAQAVEYLQELGVDGATASLALSRYLLRECLSASQADIVRSAVGRFGTPPQSTDLRIIQCASAPTPTPTPGSSKPGKVSGLRATSTTQTSIHIAWSAVNGANGYHVQSVGATGWQTVGSTSSTTFTRSGLKHNTHYKFRVTAYNVSGSGTPSNTLTATTKR